MRMPPLKPMDAVSALYSVHKPEVSIAVFNSLSQAIFEGHGIQPAGILKRLLSRFSHRLLTRTTTAVQERDAHGNESTIFRNALLERSGHAYAQSLLGSLKTENAALVEGGDPMNAQYMMIPPAIRKNGALWDRLFFDSVQGRDVQLRFIRETRATYQSAKRRLEAGDPVRMKGVAAGTGLSLILTYDKLIAEGYPAELITAIVTDRDTANIEKARRLLANLPSTKDRLFCPIQGFGISAESEDIFGGTHSEEGNLAEPFHVVTAIGIFEYFQGVTLTTTEQRHRHPSPEDIYSAIDLAHRLKFMTADDGHLIVNTYRDDPSARILEIFGRKFDYRNRAHLSTLLSHADFHPSELIGSGHVYDVEVFRKI